jgi:peptide/nickel transport system ATP-binding protein
MALLDVRDLTVTFPTPDGPVHAVRGASFTVDAGETLAIVGESGSGKSVVTQTAVGLTNGATVTGSVLFAGTDLLGRTERELRRVRGAQIGMIFQDPQSSLHPYHRVGWQVCELLHAHRAISRRAAMARTVELFDLVGIPNAHERVRDYPHQFSGGMRQRVMIAMAIALNPALVIADEPTTALDVTIQAQVMSLLARLQDDLGMALVIITHDLGVVADVADTVAVMYAGRIVDSGPRDVVFARAEHPYTRGLLDSMPGRAQPRTRLASIPGQPPSMLAPPPGCAFHPRCARALADCAAVAPAGTSSSDGRHLVACHNPWEQPYAAADDYRELASW